MGGKRKGEQTGGEKGEKQRRIRIEASTRLRAPVVTGVSKQIHFEPDA